MTDEADDDRATFITDLEGSGYITVLDADDEPTDEVDEWDKQGGGRFREWRVDGVTFEYVPERTHAPLSVEEEGSATKQTQLRPADIDKVGVEGTERYRMRGVNIYVDTAFRHPQNDSLRFKVEYPDTDADEEGGSA